MSDAAARWPVLRTFTGAAIDRVAMPIGGIGTGCVSLGGRGDLRDWEVVNRPAKGFEPDPGFFALQVSPAEGSPLARVLEGPLDARDYEGGSGSPAPHAGLPRFRSARFEAAYPLGQVVLEDPDVPIGVRIQGFNPLVPCDSEASGLPVAILRFLLTNDGPAPLAASVCGTLRNVVGTDGHSGRPSANRNQLRRESGMSGLLLSSDGVSPHAEQWGTLALAVLHDGGVTWRTAWPELTWGDALLDFWDDFAEDGRLEERSGAGDAPVASLAARLELPPGATRAVTFLLTWHFPNRRAWQVGPRRPDQDGAEIVGNHYATRHEDAWAVVGEVAARMVDLEQRTVEFVTEVCGSDLPDEVKDAALSNLSTLRTQTCFRTADGTFFGWEGCNDDAGCCPGSCTHVWNYEQATPFLFGDLARSMRDVELGHATDERGHMRFRVSLPLAEPRRWSLAAADGQMGCLLKLYRDWRLSGDDAMLRRLWPPARRALEFAWIPGGWDADQDGVMEGCQHNTLDVEFYGPSAWMSCWYLGALRAAEEMARALNEEAFAGRCRQLFAKGRQWIDSHLFNGDYYEQEVRPPGSFSDLAPGLRHERMGAMNPSDPELQLGPGCALDQLAGQFLASVAGLGSLLDPDHVARTVDSILRYNRRDGFHGHFNHMRSFALGDEGGLLLAAYPGRRPARPFPYYAEVWTGLEYAFACLLAYLGRGDDAVRVTRTVRQRYDGRRRNPFDEAECGHHYVRAMASWGLVPALTGFHYDAGEGRMELAAAHATVRWPWSSGDAWGTCTQAPRGGGIELRLEVLGGSLKLGRVALSGAGEAALQPGRVLGRGDQVTVFVVRDNSQKGAPPCGR